MTQQPYDSSDRSGYERPASGWRCGDEASGNACPLGPSRLGVCPGGTDCQPINSGGRWLCTRSAARGGPCERGPHADGICGRAPHQCAPQPTHRTRRKRLVLAAIAGTLGLLCLAIQASWRWEFHAPGPLTDSHAQLLSASTVTNRCAACHPAGNQTASQWAASLLAISPTIPSGQSASANSSQTQLCLECHRESLSPSAAQPHSVPPTELTRLTQAAARRFPTADRGAAIKTNHAGEIACAVCHQEHHGSKHDLAFVTNQQCSNCHQTSFDDFERHHPEFRSWPRRSPTSPIAFDHASHLGKHFPAAKNASFSCADCHRPSDASEVVLVTSYHQCASCHEEAIRTGTSEGLRLLQLPMLDTDAMQDIGIDDFAWPEHAQGSFDGPLEPLMFLLLLADLNAAEVCREWGPGADFYDVDPDDEDAVQSAAKVAEAIRQLGLELGENPAAVLEQRLSTAFGREIPEPILGRLTTGLSPDLIRMAFHAWFESVNNAEESSTSDQDVSPQISGWRVNANSLRFWYRPGGHADPVLRGWIELLLLPVENELVADAQRAMLTSPLVAQCTTCHVLSPSDTAVWQTPTTDVRKSFTRFAHRPHLILPQLRDCESCHQPHTPGDVSQTANASAATSSASDFRPIVKQQCAACHTRHAAGNHCLQCHHYHVNRMTPIE